MPKIKYSVSITNINTNITQTLEPFVGFSEHCLLNEELDSGSLTIVNESAEEIPIFSKVEIKIIQNIYIIKRYYVGRDSVKAISKIKPIKYEHSLELIELTKKLEKHISETLCFTQSQSGVVHYTLYDVLNRILLVTPIGEDTSENRWIAYDDSEESKSLSNPVYYPQPEHRVFNLIDPALAEKLINTEAPELVLSEGTLREKVDAVFKYINAVAKLGNSNALGAEFFNQLKNVIKSINNEDRIELNGFENITSDLNIEEYNTSVLSFGENILSNNNPIIYPSEKSFDLLRASNDDYAMNDSNCGIYTAYPIYQVNDLIIPINLCYSGNKIENIEISLKDFVLEQEIYSTLPTERPSTIQVTYSKQHSFELGKYNTIPYSYKGNFISCSNTYKGLFFSHYSLAETIMCGLSRYIVNNLEAGKFDFLGEVFETHFASYENFTPNNTLLPVVFDVTLPGQDDEILTTIEIDYHNYGTSIDDGGYWFVRYGVTNSNLPHFFQKIQYRINYTPINDIIISSAKPDISQTKCETTSLENQSNRIISFENLANNLQSTAQRKGNVEREIVIRHTNIKNIFKNGDYTEDNEIITESEYIYFNDYILGKYVLSKNYNRLSEYIGVNSEIRQWQIPSDNRTYERKILIKNFIELTAENVSDQHEDDDSYLTISGKINFLRLFLNQDTSIFGDEYVNSALFRPFDKTVMDNWNQEFNIQTSIGEDYEPEVSLLMQCSTKSSGNIINFNIKFDNNMYYLSTRNIEDMIVDQKILLEKVPYCRIKGEYIGYLKSFGLSLVSQNLYFDKEQKLPLVNLTGSHCNISSSMVERVDQQDVLVEIPPMLVLKDPSEILSIDYQINVLSNTPQIIVGKYFSIDNGLIKLYNRGEKRLKVFLTSSKIFPGMNDVLEDINSTEYENSYDDTFVCDYDTNRKISLYLKNGINLNNLIQENSYKYIIIANEKKQIYLIIDTNVILNGKRIYFNFKKYRSNVKYNY